ncbi:TonB-dependent receptor [Catenovulum sp. SM1970]|uniref:TonB-dependent receptor n=1 Tax=Marinifaba aquimaris TaxID=2741323 RepID=UPI0015739DA9|nr:TonB-dependent receptor [Marinifaba aquimaris]NTS78052.1 TonB-dependent receptor [Marinifaba aquimaris]
MKTMQLSKPRLLTSLIACAISSPALADDNQIKSIEVITVMGEKIEKSLKDTTSSVSVISEELLSNGQYQSLSAAVSEIPNVVVTSGAVANIRGVSGNGSATGFGSFTGGAKARVSTIVDGVAEPFVADLTGDTGLWDIEQVEVFRGPQSTINGRNSMGGIIFVKTKDPTFDWTGAARLGYRDESRYIDSAFALSGPVLDDELAFRVSGEVIDGETFSEGLEFDSNPTSLDLNEIKTERFRSKLLWESSAIEGLSVLASFSHNNQKGDTGRQYFLGQSTDKFVPTFQRYITTISNTSSIKFDYVINDAYSVDVLVAHMNYSWGFDSYEANAEELQVVDMQDDSDTFDAKFNFGLNSEVLKGFVGIAYYEREQDFLSIGSYPYGGDDTSKSTAIYGEASYALDEQWKIIAGGRIQKEEQKRNFEAQFGPMYINEDLDNDNTVNLPKLVVQYAITPDTTLALSARRGYNAGGGDLTWPENIYYYYDEETVNTYELSARSSFDDINLSANAFYNNFAGYQASDKNRAIKNIDKAVTYGLELEANTMLGNNWQARTALGLLESEIKEVDENFGDIKGNELNAAPNLTASIGVTYWFNGDLQFAVDTTYVGEFYADIQNLESQQAGDYSTTRFSADYVFNNWRIAAFVNNVFDDDTMTVKQEPSQRNPEGYFAILDPRNMGVSVTYNF